MDGFDGGDGAQGEREGGTRPKCDLKCPRDEYGQSDAFTHKQQQQKQGAAWPLPHLRLSLGILMRETSHRRRPVGSAAPRSPFTQVTANRAQWPRSRLHLRLWSNLAYRAKLGKGLSKNQTRHLGEC